MLQLRLKGTPSVSVSASICEGQHVLKLLLVLSLVNSLGQRQNDGCSPV